MFYGCRGDAFCMVEGFNLPQGITTVGDYFASSMFYGCRGAAFCMVEGFNLPQSITNAYGSFASAMFFGCRGDAFCMVEGFNLPQGITTVGGSFASSMFSGCGGDAFCMVEGFNLPQGITIAGNNFAGSMFYGCGGASFCMVEGFNLPQGITTAGSNFASAMFYDCGGAAFCMSEGFNLPQSITTAPDEFAARMFYGCGGAAFCMSEGFNLPQSITTVDNSFAISMFSGCDGDAFCMVEGFNLPQSITTAGTNFASYMFYGCGGAAFVVNNEFTFPELPSSNNAFYQTFYNLGTTSKQVRTATSIIGNNEVPATNMETFFGSDCFVDRKYIATNWGGDAASITVIYDPGSQGVWDAADYTTVGLYFGDATPEFMGDVTVTRDLGYTFAGWEHSITGDVYAVDSLPGVVFCSVSYVATWVRDGYIVVFDPGVEGTWTAAGETYTGLYYGDSMPVFGTKTGVSTALSHNPGYTFDGWSPLVPDTVPDASTGTVTTLTYTATWAVESSEWSTITFVNSDSTKGSFAGTLSFKGVKGSSTSAVTAPTTTPANGYEFAGWDIAIPTMYPLQDLDITGSWRYIVVDDVVVDDEFSVGYRGNGNSGGVAPVDSNGYFDGDKVTVLGQGSLVRSGYVFLGWSTNPQATTPTYTAGSTFTIQNDDVTLYAVWSPTLYTVTYLPGAHGTFAQQITSDLRYGDATPKTPTVTGETGWNFTGWSPVPSATVTGNATYTAQWTQTTTTPTPTLSPSASATPAPSATAPPTSSPSATAPPTPEVSTSPTPSTSATPTPTPPSEVDVSVTVVNLLLAAIGAVLAGVVAVFVLLKRKVQGAVKNQATVKHGLLWLVVGVVLAVVGVLVFLVTADFSLPFGWVVNKWTMLNVAIFAIETVAIWLGLKTVKTGITSK